MIYSEQFQVSVVSPNCRLGVESLTKLSQGFIQALLIMSVLWKKIEFYKEESDREEKVIAAGGLGSSGGGEGCCKPPPADRFFDYGGDLTILKKCNSVQFPYLLLTQ